MEFIYPLCSSSKGNCVYVGDNKNGVLVDAGIGIRNFSTQLQLGNIEPQSIKAICVTHEHSDHISGLFKIQRLLKVPVIATKETAKALIHKEAVASLRLLDVIDENAKVFDKLSIKAFSTPHDSVQSCAYKINLGKLSAAICTDLGHITQNVHDVLRSCNFVFLESNYEQNMLQFGKYPSYLKRRINGEYGHLSNADCAEEIGRLYRLGVKNFMLGHLSQENNMPQLAISHSISMLTSLGAAINKDYTMHVAPKLNNGNTKICFN